MFSKRKISTIFLFLFLFTSSEVISQKNPGSGIDSIMKKYKAIGLAVVIVKNNRIVYDSSFGYKNAEKKEPLERDDLFRIASISKTFSATAIMQLVQQKKLSLDEDVSSLIGFKIRNPHYPDVPITLKMLLSHRSSLSDRQGYFTLDSINPSVSHNYEKCYNDYKPGTSYEYCNYNFTIIGTIIERIGGERFDLYIKHHILDPLGLYGGYCIDSLDTSRFVTLYEYHPADSSFTPAVAYVSQREALRNYKFGYSTPVFSPTGGMKISATDLAKYMVMHKNYGKGLNGVRIIPKKLSRLMQKPLSGGEDGYGLAMMNFTGWIPGVTLTGHTGVAYGLLSFMMFDRKSNTGFVFITNGCHTDADGNDAFGFRKELVRYLYNIYAKQDF